MKPGDVLFFKGEKARLDFAILASQTVRDGSVADLVHAAIVVYPYLILHADPSRDVHLEVVKPDTLNELKYALRKEGVSEARDAEILEAAGFFLGQKYSVRQILEFQLSRRFGTEEDPVDAGETFCSALAQLFLEKIGLIKAQDADVLRAPMQLFRYLHDQEAFKQVDLFNSNYKNSSHSDQLAASCQKQLLESSALVSAAGYNFYRGMNMVASLAADMSSIAPKFSLELFDVILKDDQLAKEISAHLQKRTFPRDILMIADHLTDRATSDSFQNNPQNWFIRKMEKLMDCEAAGRAWERQLERLVAHCERESSVYREMMKLSFEIPRNAQFATDDLKAYAVDALHKAKAELAKQFAGVFPDEPAMAAFRKDLGDLRTRVIDAVGLESFQARIAAEVEIREWIVEMAAQRRSE